MKKISLLVLSTLLFCAMFVACMEETGTPQTLKTDYKEENINDINLFLNNWHQAATKADSANYFGAFDYEGVFLGTDPNERWTKNEFAIWAAEYFHNDTAWNFLPADRNIVISKEGNLAWFDEKLDTWMGTCRGSGVLVRTNKGWKIMQYNLAMLIPNEKTRSVVELIKGN